MKDTTNYIVEYISNHNKEKHREEFRMEKIAYGYAHALVNSNFTDKATVISVETGEGVDIIG